MNTTKKITVFLFLGLSLTIQVSAQSSNDTLISKLSKYVSVINHFSKNLPQENE